MNRSFLNLLRKISLIEGVSTLLLFGIAMPWKYIGKNELGVKIIGPLHGVLFILLVAVASMAISKVPIGKKLGAAVMIGAIFPFGPFIVDRWLRKV